MLRALSDATDMVSELEQRLAVLDAERAKVAAELAAARATLPRTIVAIGRAAASTVPETPADKVALFLRLFRCRESVYPKRWENPKQQKAGYSPACHNEWVRGICEKPRVKCSECPNQAFARLDESAAEAHLKGLQTIGSYAIREDDSCTFLACDFDGDGWRQDVAVFRDAARDLGLDVAVERSRSGDGAHAWLFFSEPVPARLARSLGTFILVRCSERRPSMPLESYDRFFPNQDFIPRGGFGNLIALPLQRPARDAGNSVFVDDSLEPFTDQWSYLASVRRVSGLELRTLLDRFVPRGRGADAGADASLELDREILESAATSDDDVCFDGEVTIAVSAMLTIRLGEMPSRLIARLKRVASFPNPKFYELQRMRLPTYPNPRIIFAGELRPCELLLPRGTLEKAQRIISDAGASAVIRDERPRKRRLDVAFRGELTDEQRHAVVAMKKHEVGVLVAPPGSGKTVMGCALIAERKATTLVLVHRQPLVEQWKESLRTFLGLQKGDFGVISGVKKKRTGKIDLCMLQTLTKLEDLAAIAADYTQVIIDECHHIPATSFEGVMKQLPARCVVGLTATPYRKDGCEKILFMQAGPIRHEMAAIDGGISSKEVVVRDTGFRPPDGSRLPYHVLIELLVSDDKRTLMIAADTIACLREGRVPLVISDRKDHLSAIAEAIRSGAPAETTIFQLDGDLSTKERRLVIEAMHERVASKGPMVLVATASLIGEGFNLPALDTLLLATPISFEGRLVQYAGRLHRSVEGKTSVRIYDYVDSYNAMTLKMYRKRSKAYGEMGYEVIEPPGFLASRSLRQRSLFPGLSL